MPDYEILEWNEENFAIDNPYAMEAYQLELFAFVSDYARLKIIYEEGGIYLDTDVELIKSLDPILLNGGYMGFERENTVNTGLGFAAMPKSPVIKAMLDIYDNISILNDGIIDKTPCPVRNTNSLLAMGLQGNNTRQVIEDITIYPIEYFCPVDYDTGKMMISKNTYSIHHYGYSWAGEWDKKTLLIKRRIFNIFPKVCAQQIFNIVNHIIMLKGRK